MTPREYLVLFRRRWRAVVAGLLLGLVGAGVVTTLTPAQYSAEATIFISAAPSAGDASAVLSANELSAQRMSTYVELIRSSKIAGEVAAALGPDAPAELSEHITVTSVPDTVLLAVAARSTSPDRAVRIANVYAERFIVNVAALERPADPLAPSLVTARIFQPAIADNQPISPQPLLNLAIGLFLGLVAGIGLALMRSSLDNSITSAQQLRDVLNAPVLGQVGRLSSVRNQLRLRARPWAPEAEAIRQLRTNLQFVRVGRAHKVILVTSATSSQGKTAMVCNLAVALADAGNRVLVIDAHPRSPQVAELFGLESAVGLTDVLTVRTSLKNSTQRWQDMLDVLTSGPMPPNPSELLGSARMTKLIGEVRESYDMVLIDAAPLASIADATVMAPQADGVLLVVQHGETTVPQVRDAVEALRTVRARLIGAVLTMTSGKPAKRRAERRPSDTMRAPSPGERSAPIRPAGPLPPPPPTGSGPASHPGHRPVSAGPAPQSMKGHFPPREQPSGPVSREQLPESTQLASGTETVEPDGSDKR